MCVCVCARSPLEHTYTALIFLEDFVVAQVWPQSVVDASKRRLFSIRVTLKKTLRVLITSCSGFADVYTPVQKNRQMAVPYDRMLAKLTFGSGGAPAIPSIFEWLQLQRSARLFLELGLSVYCCCYCYSYCCYYYLHNPYDYYYYCCYHYCYYNC